jgi:hypothetical protein
MVLYDLVVFLVANLTPHTRPPLTGVSVPAVSRNTIEFSLCKSFGYNADNPTVDTEYPSGRFLLLNFEARNDLPLLYNP